MIHGKIYLSFLFPNSTYLQDRYATRNGQPKVDPEQNWTLLNGTEKDGYTIVTFKRPLVSCDRENDMDVTVSLTPVESIH